MHHGIICPKCGTDTGHGIAISYYGDLTLRCPSCGEIVYQQKKSNISC